MEEKLQSLEQFFQDDAKIKQLMTFYPNVYDRDTAIAYEDKMIKNLQEIKYLFTRMLKKIGSDREIDYLNKLFARYESSLLNCKYDPKKLAQFYEACISNMDPALIDEMNCNIFGYYIFSNYQGTFFKCKTINELLHLLHTYMINSESFYQTMPIINQKEDEYENKVTLYGRNNFLAQTLFDSMDQIDSSIIDILSLKNNHILIMAKDLGHALTVEIEYDENMTHVSYFIPKVCYILMVNKLKGITPVKVDENGNLKTPYAKGSFEVETKDLLPTIIELLQNVPQDRDMSMEGGIFENKKAR